MTDLPGYLLYRILSGLFGALPEPAARRLGEVMGWAASWVLRGRMRIARRNMRRVLGPRAPEIEIRRRARSMFVSYGRYWAEVFWVRPRRKQEIVSHSELVNGDILLNAAATGRGVIVALPHVGNWEAAGAVAESIGVPVLAAAEALRNRRIVEWFVWCRNALGIEVVVVERGARVTSRLVGRLRDGKTVALIADRDLKGTGIDVEFFGERTTLPPGPVALAERTGAVLLPVGAYFKDGRGHRFVIHDPVEIPEEGDRRERVEVGTQRFAEALEDVIRVAPEQWHLLVPNWPTDWA